MLILATTCIKSPLIIDKKYRLTLQVYKSTPKSIHTMCSTKQQSVRVFLDFMNLKQMLRRREYIMQEIDVYIAIWPRSLGDYLFDIILVMNANEPFPYTYLYLIHSYYISFPVNSYFIPSFSPSPFVYVFDFVYIFVSVFFSQKKKSFFSFIVC